jgi:predicted Zn-dependent protease
MQRAQAVSPREECPLRQRGGPRQPWRGGILALALASCALNPVTKAPEISFTSLEEEKEAGASIAAQIGEEIGPLGDEALTGYVQALGARLAAGSPRKDIEYRFQILDTEAPNAFVLPAGYVYVTRGLLALVDDESELVGVLAHQIAHDAARHASNTTLGSAASGVLSGLGNIAAGMFGGFLGSIGTPGSIVPPHDEDQEAQADEIGQELAFKAGFDPAGLLEFIRTYDRVVRRDKTSVETGFLLVHPTSAQRIEAARARAAKLGKPTPAPEALDRAAFLAKLRGLVLGQDVRAGIFDAKVPTLFIQPDLNFRIRFPDGWQTLNAPAFVAATDGAIRITLEPGGEGTDLKKAANDYTRERKERRERAENEGRRRGSGEELTRTKSGMRMLDKKRASYVIEGTANGGQTTVLQYWIDVKPNIYLVTCAMATQAKGQYLGDCRKTAASVRPTRKKDREGLRQTTLELAEARPGEQLEDFNDRVGNSWTVEQTAASNGLSLPYKLSPGQLLKYAQSRPYEPKPPSASAPAEPANESDEPESDVPETEAPGSDD